MKRLAAAGVFGLLLASSVAAWGSFGFPIVIPPTAAPPPLPEEFVGPFANWLCARTLASGTCGAAAGGYGTAVGDGVTDDSAALQTSVTALSSTHPVLWVPSGTYAINTVQTTATAAMSVTAIVVASASNITSGQFVLGTGIAAETYVTNVAGTTITISKATTAPLSATTVKFQLAEAGTQNFSIIGQDPATTTIKWAGGGLDVMFRLSGNGHFRVNRLTFDGNSIAYAGPLEYYSGTGNFFDTGNEYADDVIKNFVFYGFDCGDGAAGCAEVSLLRDTFSGNGAGIELGDSNALDIWTWYGTFTNNGKGVENTNGGGNFHVFNSNFSGSTTKDIGISNTGLFTLYNNYSAGSAQFVVCAGSHNPSVLLLESNVILNTTTSPEISCGNQGPIIALDNTISGRVGATAPVISLSDSGSDILTTGNTYTIGTANVCSAGGSVQSAGRCHDLGDSVVAQTSPSAPTLPGTPLNRGRTIYEASASGSGSTCSGASPCSIQTAISTAASAGNGAVAHIQAGTYSIASTIVIPANTYMQVIGDGAFSKLSWSGGASGLVMKCTGPCKTTFRDFLIDGNSGAASALQITNADQSGGRVFTEQLYANFATTNGLLVNALDNTNVELHDCVIVGSSATVDTVKVVGGAGANNSVTKMFACAGGGGANEFRIAANGHLAIRQKWTDAGEAVPASATTFQTSSTGGSISVAAMADYLGGTPGTYWNLTGFTGVSALLGVDMHEGVTPETQVISGTGSGANNLNVGMIGCSASLFTDTTSPIDSYDLLDPQEVAACGGGGATTQVTEASQGVSSTLSFLNTTLAPLRAAVPTIPGVAGDPALAAGVTDARFYRVTVQSAIIGFDVEH
jgi:hypothetical protein